MGTTRTVFKFIYCKVNNDADFIESAWWGW